MILTEHLSKQFDQFLAVDSIDLEVKAGEVLALLGPNGAGKTTTVRMLTSVLKPTGGRAIVAGYDVVEQPAKVRASVGVLTEQHGLYERMPARDYLDFFGQIYGMSRADRQKQARYWLGRFGLEGVQQQRIGEFSKGMRQKLALARALLHNPPVLLLDEPTSAMDPESARLVRDSIHLLRSESRAVLLCTHNLVEAEELADRIAIIRRGRIILYGPPSEIKRQLLGPSEFEAHLTAHLNGYELALPEGAELTGQGQDWFRYRVECPEQTNPRVLEMLVRAGIGVVSLQELPRSLEEVYLKAMSGAGQGIHEQDC
jgi:ABC-2 type transport system ATP-binding protein